MTADATERLWGEQVEGLSVILKLVGLRKPVSTER